MKIVNILAKVIFSLICVLPALGLTGIFPPPTRDLYNTDAAFAFILVIMESAQYIDYIMVAALLLAVGALWTKREALGALLALPVTVNVVGFHAFLDGGLLTGGAILGNIMLLINVYFLYKNREILQALLLTKKSE